MEQFWLVFLIFPAQEPFSFRNKYFLYSMHRLICLFTGGELLLVRCYPSLVFQHIAQVAEKHTPRDKSSVDLWPKCAKKAINLFFADWALTPHIILGPGCQHPRIAVAFIYPGFVPMDVCIVYIARLQGQCPQCVNLKGRPKSRDK